MWSKPHFKGLFVPVITLLLAAGIAFPIETIRDHEIGIVDPAEVITCFSSSENCRELIINEIENAEKSIDAAVYSFTNLELSKALIDAHSRGVKIRFITDNLQSKGRYSKSQFLVDSGIPVRLDGNDGYMHHKFAVFDGKSVIFGSYNWSNSAETRNDENLVLIRNEDFARDFEGEFESMWNRYK